MYLTYYLPSLLSQHRSQYIFYLNAYLVSLKPQTFGFPLDLEDLEASFTIFLIMYTLLVVINFLKLFKSDMYIGPSPSQS